MSWRYQAIKTMLNLSGQKTWQYYQQALYFSQCNEKYIHQTQRTLLSIILKHSYINIPYYKELLDSTGNITDDLPDLNIFTQLPALTKKIIREQNEKLYSSDMDSRGTYNNTSGGSTGEPVKFIQDKQYDQWNTANKLYFNQILGKLPGDPEIKFWGSDRDIIQGSLGTKENIINYIYNRKFFNSYNISSSELDKLISLNNKFKPAAYWAYMEAAIELAKYLSKTGKTFTPPKFIVSTIAPLTESNKNIIEHGMKCRVYNQYGSREVGAIACQDRNQDCLYSFPWTHYIEIVDDNNKPLPPGQPGKILITTLQNYSMPLIRYEIGDVGIEANTNEKQRPGFAFKEVIGRTLGYFKKADGSLKHSHFLVQALFNYNWIKKFQIIQTQFDCITIKIVKDKPENQQPQDDIQKITKLIADFMDNNCKVNIDFVDQIPVSQSGKHIYTICRC